MSVFVRQNAIEMEYTKDAWAILNPIEQSIKAKIEKYGTPLKKWDISINYGIKTGCNEAFIITGEKRKELVAEDPKSDEIIRPILRGRDIKRYGYEFADLWLINIECGFTNKHRGKTPPEEFIKSKYPAIYKHFMQVSNAKTKGKGLINRDDKGDYWWELRSCAYTNDFSRQKIVYGQFRKGSFAFDNNGCFLSSNEYFIWTDKLDLKFLLGLLNSKICYYFGCISMNSLGGATTIAQKDIFIKFPILNTSSDIQSKIIHLVEQINQLKTNNCSADTKDLENQIDQYLYTIYKLSKEEIQLIVKTTSQQK